MLDLSRVLEFWKCSHLPIALASRQNKIAAAMISHLIKKLPLFIDVVVCEALIKKEAIPLFQGKSC